MPHMINVNLQGIEIKPKVLGPVDCLDDTLEKSLLNDPKASINLSTCLFICLFSIRLEVFFMWHRKLENGQDAAMIFTPNTREQQRISSQYILN